MVPGAWDGGEHKGDGIKMITVQTHDSTRGAWVWFWINSRVVLRPRVVVSPSTTHILSALSQIVRSRRFQSDLLIPEVV